MAAPQDILVSFSKEQLLKMSKQEGISLPSTSTKATLLKDICPIVEDLAIKKITSSFSKIQLEQIVNDAKVLCCATHWKIFNMHYIVVSPTFLALPNNIRSK